MKTPVKKYSRHAIVHEYDNLFVLTISPGNVPDGKLILSLKLGKKRIMVSGRLQSVPESDRELGLSYKFEFRTTTEKQRQKLLSRIPWSNQWPQTRLRD